MGSDNKKKKKLSQASLEICVVFILAVGFVMLMIKVWLWAVAPIIPRQRNYNNTRVISCIAAHFAGGVSGGIIRGPAVWPIFHHVPLTKEYLFKNR